jgi:hypothetical protein
LRWDFCHFAGSWASVYIVGLKSVLLAACCCQCALSTRPKLGRQSSRWLGRIMRYCNDRSFVIFAVNGVIFLGVINITGVTG